MRWTIRKKVGVGVYDTFGASILGPSTDPIEVMPASFTDEDVERVAFAVRQEQVNQGLTVSKEWEPQLALGRAALSAYLEPITKGDT